jgi:NAD(P)-dependent dehydrogenase (short-subunit alcohol dehydrogenase family)
MAWRAMAPKLNKRERLKERKMTTAQTPLGSGFGWGTTAEEVIAGVDLTGKTIIVTGCYGGIGLEAVRALAGAGAKIIAAVRAPERAHPVFADMPGVEVEALDLMDPTSIDAFVRRFNASGRPLHVLINNAGIMAAPLMRDARGYEAQFATNHLGHFQLTAGLWPALQRAGRARVVSLTSGSHRHSPVLFDDVNFERTEYEKHKAYGQSKSANSLFAVELDKRGESQGIRAFAVHPGIIYDTGLSKYMSAEELAAPSPGGPPKTPQQGASTTVWCATSPLLNGKGGVYCENTDVAEAAAADKPTPGGVRPWAIDRGFAERLWTLSETMTGVSFGA